MQPESAEYTDETDQRRHASFVTNKSCVHGNGAQPYLCSDNPYQSVKIGNQKIAFMLDTCS